MSFIQAFLNLHWVFGAFLYENVSNNWINLNKNQTFQNSEKNYKPKATTRFSTTLQGFQEKKLCIHKVIGAPITGRTTKQ